ncbi:LysR family transcriptional regulator for bpeEF and oprC [Oceanisphaera litoralis]|uniref:LysR substrate-binding domain-containing protein n=1 Tax=Oceanisphaera litoralis TaxID=225144 RepID=UPI00195A9DF7|nr:LysR family transcriptional regulator [Oceanisphaera litoralis]MBM7454681.1 LysR family transcriptional regulator for bpeEF and oprC [Oceanisphaera litoralis]
MELLKTMQVFCRLAELGSFTQAAEAMQLGRPQVTRTIQELETSLGVRLFHRTTRKVRLTDEGEQFYERAREILGDVAKATSMFRRSNATIRGKLRIDVPAAFAQPKLIENLREFTSLYPEIELALGVTDRTVDLVAEGVDCAIRIGELPDSSLVARRIGEATMVTCAAPSYIRDYGEPKTLEDLHAHYGVRFLSGHNKRPLPWHFLDGSKDQTYVNRHGIIVNESNAYVECGVAGFGILQAPGITLERHLIDGSLVEVLRAYRPRPQPVSVLYPSRSHLAPQVHAFAEWVVEQFPTIYQNWIET